MNRFIAQLNDSSYVNVPADKMEKIDNMLYAYNGGNLMAAVEITAVIVAYLSEKGDKNGPKEN